MVALSIWLKKTIFGFTLLSFSAFSFDTINAIPTPNSPQPAVKWLSFIAPNELCPWKFGLHASTQTGKKALTVSVGTIRALMTFIYTKNSHLLMADIDHQITNFNHDHLYMIKKIAQDYGTPKAQRLAYILQWHGCVWSKMQIEAYAEDFSLPTFKEKLPKWGFNSTIHPILEHESGLHLAFRNTNTSFDLFGYDPAGSSGYYWNSDELWQKITLALAEERIAIGRIDVVEEIAELIKFSNDTGLPLDTLDISNIPCFHFLSTSRSKWAQALRSSDLKVDCIMHTHPSLGGGFSYVCASQDEFLRYLEKE